MTDTPPRQKRPPAAVPPRRQVAVPGTPQPSQRRIGLLLLGVVLVFGASFGSWYVFQSIDERAEYLVAARTIERWQVVGAGDFTVVEANVGTASALTPEQLGGVAGLWSAGRIPAGTLITAGMFELPPLASESEADRVLIQLTLPASEAPRGTLAPGDKVALIGRTGSEISGAESPLRLIGVLQIEEIAGDNLYYVLPPLEAFQIKNTLDSYAQARDRLMLKLGFNLTEDDLVAALGQQAGSVVSIIPDALNEEEPATGAVEDQ